jgi:hypothetical protein
MVNSLPTPAVNREVGLRVCAQRRSGLTLPPAVTRKLPLEVHSLLAALSKIEREVLSTPDKGRYFWGSDFLVRCLAGERPSANPYDPFEHAAVTPIKRPEGVAVIPGYAAGRCEPILLTVVGYADECEFRILEAIEYLSRCRGVTKHVVFYSINWSALAWADHRDSFRAARAIPILKLMGCEPVVLNPMY